MVFTKNNVDKKKFKLPKINWVAISACSTFFLTLLTLYLVMANMEIINQSKEQFQELNRPYIVIDQGFGLKELGGNDSMIAIGNIGKIAAKNLVVNVSYNDKNGNRKFLMDELSVGTFYPEESRNLIMKNPCNFLNEMQNFTFTIDLSYKYLNQCISYNQTITFNGTCNSPRSHAPDENVETCK